jgi:DNA polymerase sigma
LKLRSYKYNVELDLTLYQSISNHKTNLLLAYCQVLDDESLHLQHHQQQQHHSAVAIDFVRKFVSSIKYWASKRGINDAENRTMNSYSLTLMAIAYLQQIGVLPNLQHTTVLNQYEQKAAATNPQLTTVRPYANEEQHWKNVLNESLLTTYSIPQEWLQHAQSSSFTIPPLSDAIIGFLHFYATIFNPTQHIISVRHGGLVKRSFINDSKLIASSMWICLDPFQIADSSARSVNLDGAMRIRNAMLHSLQYVDNMNAMFIKLSEKESNQTLDQTFAMGKDLWNAININIPSNNDEMKQNKPHVNP